eukprot:6241178-Amphidinium_carterae.2
MSCPSRCVLETRLRRHKLGAELVAAGQRLLQCKVASRGTTPVVLAFRIQHKAGCVFQPCCSQSQGPCP